MTTAFVITGILEIINAVV